MHQCAMFCSDLKRPHKEVVKHIGRYLNKKYKARIIYEFNTDKGIECYVDVYFSGT